MNQHSTVSGGNKHVTSHWKSVGDIGTESILTCTTSCNGWYLHACIVNKGQAKSGKIDIIYQHVPMQHTAPGFNHDAATITWPLFVSDAVGKVTIKKKKTSTVRQWNNRAWNATSDNLWCSFLTNF